MRNGPYELVVAPVNYPGMKYRGRYCYEHTLVWWQNTGEVPDPGELVHHRDENKRNNAFGNLAKKTIPEHAAEHARGRTEPPLEATCPVCLRSFSVKRRDARARLKVSKSGRLFCSRSCGATHQFSTRIG